MSINDVISENSVQVTRIRPGMSATVNGYRVSAADVVTIIEAVVQPMSAKELRNTPEGQNTLQWMNIWSEFDLKEKDKIDYSGTLFTIQRFEYWPEGPFWHAQAVKVDDHS